MGYRTHPLSDGASAEVHQMIKNRLAEAINQGESVVVDSSFWSLASREEYREYLMSLGISPVVYYLDTPRDVILQRLAERKNRSGNDIVVPHELALRYMEGLQVPTEEEGDLKIIKS
jgi:predicted kinase